MGVWMKKNQIVLFSLALILLLGSFRCKSNSPTEPGSQPEPEPKPRLGTNFGDIAIDFTAKDQNGNDVSLYDFTGKVILVVMSAEWCSYCQNEATHLESLYNEYEQRGLRVIATLILGDPAEWAKEYGLSFPVLDDNSEAIWTQYGEGYLPLNFVIDREMIIRYKEAGFDKAAIRAVIERNL
jgi:peroxiredoxin